MSTYVILYRRKGRNLRLNDKTKFTEAETMFERGNRVSTAAETFVVKSETCVDG